MSRKKKAKAPPPLPDSPEFQSFVGNLRQIMAVPKSEIDRMLAEERAAKAVAEPETDEPLDC